ncbi:MAG: META domain-containing protein [Lewinella sp.]|nr:META domain-containing protein [Lewinella sp.]
MGCTTPNSSANKGAEPLEANASALAGSRWALERYQPTGAKMQAATGEAYVSFQTDGQIGGNTGCNAFGGTYTQTKAGLKTAQLFTTKRFCQQMAEQEKTILAVFTAGPNFSQDLTQSVLTLSAEGQQLVFIVAPAGESPGEKSNKMTGLFTYFADAAGFKRCSDGKSFSVAVGEGDYLKCEQAYSNLDKGGQPAYLEIEGELIDNPEKEGPRQLLRITKMLDLTAAGQCPGQ